MRRIIGFLLLALFLFAVITQPRTAANAVQSIVYVLREAAENVTVFFRELV